MAGWLRCAGTPLDATDWELWSARLWERPPQLVMVVGPVAWTSALSR